MDYQFKDRFEGLPWVNISRRFNDTEGSYKGILLDETFEMLVEGGSLIRHCSYTDGGEFQMMVFVPKP